MQKEDPFHWPSFSENPMSISSSVKKLFKKVLLANQMIATHNPPSWIQGKQNQHLDYYLAVIT